MFCRLSGFPHHGSSNHTEWAAWSHGPWRSKFFSNFVTMAKMSYSHCHRHTHFWRLKYNVTKKWIYLHSWRLTDCRLWQWGTYVLQRSPNLSRCYTRVLLPHGQNPAIIQFSCHVVSVPIFRTLTICNCKAFYQKGKSFYCFYNMNTDLNHLKKGCKTVAGTFK